MEHRLPAHVTAAIDTLIDLIDSGRPVAVDQLRTSLNGLVQAGIAIAENRHRPGKPAVDIPVDGVEIRARRGQSAPDDDAEPLPADACRASFLPPRAMRNDPRYKEPCALKRGHERDGSKHQNRRGVTWGGRSKPRLTLSTSQATPPARRETPVTPSKQDLNARMQRLGQQMQTRRAQPAAQSRRARSVTGPGDPLDQARAAVQLATPPQWGWLPSERHVVLERLEQAGNRLLQHAVDTRATDTAHRREIEELRRQLLDVRSVLTPGSSMEVRQATLDRLTTAMRALEEPLTADRRVHRAMVLNFARRAEAFKRPVPEAPQHPWLPDRHIA